MARAHGVLPDEVIRDHRADGFLLFASLRPELDRAGVQSWLQEVTRLVGELEVEHRGDRVATVATAFSPTFFGAAGAPRFELAGRAPAAFTRGAVLRDVPDVGADVVFYILSTSEAATADFLRGIAATRSQAVVSMTIERGFQRADGRELFGFKDGSRNAQGHRERIALVDRSLAPEEPDWAEDGSYMAYLKLPQNIEAFAGKPQAEQEQIMGRRKSDGSRLDLPEGTKPRNEGPFQGDSPAKASHVRKVGPRRPGDEAAEIFRRGLPYLTLRPDVSPDAGLQFVSFQATLEQFETVFDHWMRNPNFPDAGAGRDALLASGMVTIEKGGLFFVPPADPRFVGATMFDPARQPPKRPPKQGRIVVRKRIVDAAGTPVPAELAGIGFQVFKVEGGDPIGEIFRTSTTGRALSPKVPTNIPLLVREVAPPAGITPPPDASLTLTTGAQMVEMTNTVTAPIPGYQP